MLFLPIGILGLLQIARSTYAAADAEVQLIVGLGGLVILAVLRRLVYADNLPIVRHPGGVELGGARSLVGHIQRHGPLAVREAD